MKYDFCVVGGGMVGSAMALAVAALGHQVAWVSGPSVKPFNPVSEPDVRMSALSKGSIDFLMGLDAWSYVTAMRCKQYDTLTVWEGDASPASFYAREMGSDYLGYFVENRLVQLACEQALSHYSNVHRVADCQVVSCEGTAPIRVALQNGDTIEANWLIGADGGRSVVRHQAGILTSGWQYTQQAMGIIVELTEDSGSETWQQFHPTGPRALLPMHDKFAALIWYDDAHRLKAISALNENHLVKEITANFPARLPAIDRVVSFAQFPLTRMHARTYMSGNTLLVGDAAHLVNPLAGQGVNMGFGDAKCLAKVMGEYNPHSPYAAVFVDKLKTAFAQKRRRENTTMMLTLDAVYNVFKVPAEPVRLLRQLGLFAAHRSGPLKTAALKRAAGLLDF
ncbi:2-octaprenyl-3-methyl-6-methoxy-1,4-benzoquinol hydroxylase [Alteromonas sediminis]|uniref:2-octaprenyl-3-methyl-6-methoxy-1,4-benzoquinol hydroxylase n=1 Tax=Alteromonas sediminis TaxID=2259342 RepID=A0A3N5Z8H9_9ALTE|nr:FAD-dependent monooxygenase [Alteromonas sediminis]RPJ67164.1 2-octaprenyl-3-methyl-6-methoxy-1,4-benzoquinol hydroxylase [Alteromonas sediminis]